jgi:hypothetical protein
MRPFARPALRWSALVALWGVVIAVFWVELVQMLLLVWNPFCHWQGPGVSHVTVVSVDRDPQSQITDSVTVKEGRQERDLTMLKTEAAELAPGEGIWVLDSVVSDGLRPDQYRLTPLRLLLQYPFLLLLPVAWALWGLRRARLRTEVEPPPPVRRVFTDDFHLRAQRFAPPDSSQAEPPANPDPGAKPPER